MDGNVTIALVVICFSVAAVAVSITIYFNNKFQSKSDADKVETDLKAWIRKVETDVSKVQSSLERIAENVSYIRGRIEPKTSQGGTNETHS